MKRLFTLLAAVVVFGAVIGLVGLPSPFAHAATPWSGIIAPVRAIDWSGAGVIGGIPTNRTQCGATINAYSGAPDTINNAIANCGANQYVQLGAGTFNLSSGIIFNSTSNVTLRGMGANQTLLVFSTPNGCQGVYADICIQSSDTNWNNGPSNTANWTSGYAQGTTNITLSSVANLKVGNPIVLDQLDDTADTGAVYVCSTTACSLQGGGGGQRAGRFQFQVATVTGCNGVTTTGASCSGSNVTVTIGRGLDMPNWSASKSPQAWWASNPPSGDGVESLSVDNTASEQSSAGEGIAFFNATNSWVKGVRDIDSLRAHVGAEYSNHITVEDSYFYLTQNSIDQSYGFDCFTSSDNLVQNNIYQGVSGALTMNGCTGSVFSYNVGVNNFYVGSAGWIQAQTNPHAGGTAMVLEEGNVGTRIDSDLFHGTHNFLTLFRNYWSGWEPACWVSGANYQSATYGACNNPFMAIDLLSYSRFYNVIGNVLGHAGTQDGYQNTSQPIYNIGIGASVNGVTIGNDPLVATTLMRWGNYDTFNGSVQWNTSEVPSNLTGAAAPYSNPVPSSQNLPASFYLTSKPAWWGSSTPYPAIGPDVTGGSVAGVGGHADLIPAQVCYNSLGGNADGNSPELAFNAANCYPGDFTGSSGGGGGTTPPPPADTTPPSTSISSPANGATVSGTASVTASASDNVGVTRVEFYLDGALQTTVTAAPYTWSWVTTGSANGTHTIQTKAYDAAGNVGTSPSISVTVSNTTSGGGGGTTGGGGHNYSTSFPLTENPISENGNWINGGQSPALDWTNMRTIPGEAYGTEANTHANDDDSTAILTGTWGPNQTVTGVVHETGQAANQLEVELRLRVTFASHSITGYEIDLAPGYRAIVRWNGALNSFTVLTSDTTHGISNNDTYKATITGTSPATITVYANGTQVMQATDNNAFTSGAPGMGWFTGQSGGDPTQTDLGWSSFTATDGTTGGGGTTGDTTPPSTPSNLAASAASTSQINLSWSASTDNVAVTGYKIFRNGTQIATTAGTTYSDTGLAASTNYSYTVSAFDAAGNNSGQSAAANATTRAAGDTTPPTTAVTVPGNNATVSGTTQVTASASDNVGVTRVEFYLDGALQTTVTAAPYTWNWATTGSANGTHTLSTKAYDAAGNVGTSPNITVTVNNAVVVRPGITSPLTAAGVVGTPFSYSVTASNVPTSFSASGLPQGLTLNPTTGQITGSPASAGTTDATIGAANSAGSATATLVITVTAAADTTPPSIPSNVSLIAKTTSTATLSWTASTDNVGVVGYKIFRGGVQVNTVAGTSFTDTGLTPGTLYVYTVAAFDAAGNTSGQSVSVNAATQALPDTTPPSTPTNFTATAVSTSQINLAWAASSDNVAVAGYKVYRNGAQIATTQSTTYSDTGLTSGTSFSYTVAAYDAAGNTSGQTASKQATTLTVADTTPPTSAIVSPSANATLSGTVTISVTASDNIAVSKVELYVDGSLKATLTGAPYSFSLDTTSLANGTHTLQAKAYDAVGNVGPSNSVTVTVTNAPATLTASLTASPASGVAPLTTTLTATAGGTATGNVTYTFYCNRADTGTNLTTPADLTVTVAASTYTASNVCSYQTSGTDMAKVIVTRGTAPAAQAEQPITVTKPVTTPPPTTITSVTVGQITANSAQIVIQTSQASTVQVNYGTTTGYGHTTALSPSLTTIYVPLSGLTQNTTYDFDVVATPQNGATPATSQNFTFTTQPSTTGGSGGTSNFPPLTQHMYLGTSGSQVTELQTLLIQWGYLSGAPSGYYGNLTYAAVKAFQQANGISPASGLVGSLTLAKINSLIGSTGGGTGAGGGTGGGTSGGSGGGTPGAAPAFIQANDINVQASANESVAFNSATHAGNTIVAYVIWDNVGSVSLTDSRGDVFHPASGPVTWGANDHAQVFYASKIAGGSDIVTASFGTPVQNFGVLYIHEYSGISSVNPVDVTAMSSGTSGSLNSGNAQTTAANDLIFGAGVSSNIVTQSGPGFTIRDIADGNITEDKIAATPGSYGATATQNGNAWGMQMVAFRAGQ